MMCTQPGLAIRWFGERGQQGHAKKRAITRPSCALDCDNEPVSYINGANVASDAPRQILLFLSRRHVDSERSQVLFLEQA